MKKSKSYFKDKQILLNSILIVLLIIMLYPLALTIWNSVKIDLQFQTSKWYPTLPVWLTNYQVALPKVWRYMLNTVIVAVGGTLGMLLLSSLAAYGFARIKIYGKEAVYLIIIALMMIPGVLTLVPSYMLWKNIIGLNNYAILILPVIIGGSVFGIFLLRSFFEGIPEDIFESARIDGANELLVYFKICLPMSIPIMGTLSIMQITGIWNDYMWPLITIQNEKLMTISVGLLTRFANMYGTNYPIMFSSYMVASIPLILLFIFANKFYIEGLTSAAIKM